MPYTTSDNILPPLIDNYRIKIRLKLNGSCFKQFGKEVWESIKKDIETINSGEKAEYGKVFKKIRFESNDDLPMNKPIKIDLFTIIMRCVFSEDVKFYPQLFLDDALYELV